MRLSGLVIATILLVSATLVLAQHASGGGSSSGGSSHSGYSGGGSSASSTSSHTFNASASHVGSTGASASHTASFPKSSTAKASAAPEKKSSRSVLHPFRKPVQTAEFKRPAPCLKGRCPVCPPGESRNGTGACVPANNVCATGQSWNGLTCSAQYWYNDCADLAGQLAAYRRQMRGRNDPGQALFYRLLQQQYESCMARYGSRMLSDAFLFDTLPDGP